MEGHLPPSGARSSALLTRRKPQFAAARLQPFVSAPAGLSNRNRFGTKGLHQGWKHARKDFTFPVDASTSALVVSTRLRIRRHVATVSKHLKMTEGYCVKCKAKRAIMNVMEEQMRDGRKAITGKCPSCGEDLFRIRGDEISNPSANPVVRIPVSLGSSVFAGTVASP